MDEDEELLKTFELASEGKHDEAIELTERIKERPDLDTEDQNVLRMFNNYLICCIHAKQYDKGSRFADGVQELGPGNPHIYHNAACLYCHTDQLEKAVEQIRLARKYGGMELIRLLTKDEDLKPIFDHPGFIEAISPKKRKAEPVFMMIPKEGPDHPMFRELEDGQCISMYFTYREGWDKERFKSVNKALNSWFDSIDWSTAGGSKDDIQSGVKGFPNGFELHVLGISTPNRIVALAIDKFKEISGDLIQVLILKREFDMESNAPGATIQDKDTPEFDHPGSEEEFWQKSFDGNEPIPYSEDVDGMFQVITLNDGNVLSELRGPTIYIPGLRISYELANVDDLPYDEVSEKASQLLQLKLAKYFYGDVPDIYNKESEPDGPLDRIEKDGRKGFAFVIKRDHMLEGYHSRFRMKEYEMFLALREVIDEMGLEPVIHWYRGDVYIFNIWERK